MSSQRLLEVRTEELLQVSVGAARIAAEYIAEQAPTVATLDWREKRHADFVSDVDTEAEARISDALRQVVPDATILGEELSPGAEQSAETVFVVDPLDGTTNFLHGYPEYAVSIGALLDGALVSGVVLSVPHRELFTARRDGGAFRDGQRVQVSNVSDPSRSLIGTGFPFKRLDRLVEYQRQFERITRESSGIRRAGSAALDLCDVACGRFDGFWELHLAPWDIAAGMLIVREAGGVVTDLRGSDIAPAHTEVVASNGRLHAWMLEALR